MKLSDPQRSALIHAYAPEYSIAIRLDPDEEGFAVQTLHALHRRGLIEPKGDGDYEDAQVTDAGREALGVTALEPADLEGAVRQAVALITGLEVEEYFGAGDVPRVCMEEDELRDTSLWTDTTGVLAAVEMGWGSGWVPHEYDPDVLLDAVARAVTEQGYPVEVCRFGTLVYFSSPERDG